MVAVTLFCVGAGWIGMKLAEAERQRSAVEKLSKLGVSILYEYQFKDMENPWRGQLDKSASPRGPEWLRNRLGVDFFNHAIDVNIDGVDTHGFDEDAFRTVFDLSYLRTLTIDDLLIEGAIAEKNFSLFARLPNLESIVLHSVNIGDEGLRQVCLCTRLKSLEVGSTTKLSSKGLAQISRLNRLEYLSLRGQPLDDDALQSFRCCAGLKYLDLTATKVTDSSMDVVGGFVQLETLWLVGTQLTDVGLERLSKLHNITMLHLWNTRITDAGLASLRQMRQLKSVSLSNNHQITDAGMKSLEEELPALEWIDLHGTQITAAGYKRFVSRRPKVKVDVDKWVNGS